MPERPTAVAEHLIAALSDGQRTPQEALSGLHEIEAWDLHSLAELLQELHESSRAGRLSEQDFGTLSLILNGWRHSASDDDPNATEELDAQPLAKGQSAPWNVATTPVELHPGSILRDRYVLGELAARGGMSIVFRARDLRRDASGGDSPEIALKVLRDDLRTSESAIARLKREFRQTQALRHAGVVRMLDLDCDRDVWFITMELLEGMSLEDRLRQAPAQPLEVAEALRIASVCAEVLAHAHQHGMPHGDFKPGNVFVENSGAIKVLDFGAAPELRPSPVAAASDSGPISRVATRAYASPEVLAGLEVEPRDDVFSFACVVYELLSGRHPFGRRDANEARDAWLVAEPLPQLSPGQNAALVRGLAWTRAERTPTVQGLMRPLLNHGGIVSVEPAPLSAGLPSRANRVPRQWLVAPGIAALLIVIWHMRAGDDRETADHAVRSTPAVPGRPFVVTAPVVRERAPLASDGEQKPVGRSETSAPSAPRQSRAAAPTHVAARSGATVWADSASIVVSEGTYAAVIMLRRQGDLASPVRINWRVSDGSARAREDFDGPATGTTTFLPGQTTRAVYVPLINDAVREGEESFSLRLSSNSAAIRPTGNVTITIVDDDR